MVRCVFRCLNFEAPGWLPKFWLININLNSFYSTIQYDEKTVLMCNLQSWILLTFMQIKSMNIVGTLWR